MFLLLYEGSLQRAPVVYRNIASVVASCNTNNFFFGAEIFNPQKKQSAKIKCLLYRPKPQKFHTAEITRYTVFKRLESQIIKK